MLLGLTGCHDDRCLEPLPIAEFEETPENGEIVAMVGGSEISAQALRREMVRRGAIVPERFDELSEKESLVKEVARNEMLALAAREAGYEQHPEVMAGYKKILADRFWREQLRALSAELAVTDAEVREHYDENLDAFRKVDRARLSVIQQRIPAKATAQERKRMLDAMNELRSEIVRSGEVESRFAQVARDRSDHRASRARGGDLGWVPIGMRSHAWDAEVLAAGFQLERVGDVSEAIESRSGAHLALLTGREEGASSFATVGDSVAKIRSTPTP